MILLYNESHWLYQGGISTFVGKITSRNLKQTNSQTKMFILNACYVLLFLVFCVVLCVFVRAILSWCPSTWPVDIVYNNFSFNISFIYIASWLPGNRHVGVNYQSNRYFFTINMKLISTSKEPTCSIIMSVFKFILGF